MIIRKGATRWVWLTQEWAIKFPALSGYRNFLSGLLANDQEVAFSKAGLPELCPVVFHIPFGLLVVMPRASMMTLEQWHRFNYELFVHIGSHSADQGTPGYVVPVERKIESFGYITDGASSRLVAIDYGS